MFAFGGFILFVSLLLAVHQSSSAAVCQTSPTLALGLGPCRVLENRQNDVNSWGLKIGVQGTEICAAPSTTVNSTVLTEAAICGPTQLNTSVQGQPGIIMTDKQCRSRRGGYVDQSTLQLASPADLANLGALNPGWASFGNNITVGANVTLELLDETVTDLVGLITEGQMSTNSHFGLASGSTILQRLVNAGLIASRSWGLNAGSQSVLAPRPGSLVLGGYDRGSLAGPFYDYKITNTPQEDRYCPLQVLVTGLNITAGGVSTVLVGKADKWNACVEPYDNLFRVPGPTLELLKPFLKSAINFSGDSVSPLLYQNVLLDLEPGIIYPKAAGALNATLRFTINYNQTVEIPAFEIQRPLRGLDANGEVTLDTDYNELQIYGTPAEGDASVLGKAFLSQLYLYVNYDEGMFHLADQNIDAVTPLLVSSNNCSNSNSNSEPSSNLDAIHGLIGGLSGLVVLILLAILGFFAFRKYRSWKPSEPPNDTPIEQIPQPPRDSSSHSRGNTIDSSEQPPWGQEHPPHSSQRADSFIGPPI